MFYKIYKKSTNITVHLEQLQNKFKYKNQGTCYETYNMA